MWVASWSVFPVWSSLPRLQKRVGISEMFLCSTGNIGALFVHPKSDFPSTYYGFRSNSKIKTAVLILDSCSGATKDPEDITI